MKGTNLFNVPLTDQEFELFRSILEAETGIVLKQSKRQLLKNRLRPLLAVSGKTRYIELLDGLENSGERFAVLSTIVDAITTNLTQFFRENHQFKILENRALPEICDDFEEENLNQATIWCAGCSTGQEVYSIGMVLRESVPRRFQSRFRLLATDIDSSVLARAKAGVYSPEEMRGVSEERLQQHFRKTPEGDLEVSQKLKDFVRFSPRNLIDSRGWGPGRYQMIFCRNVLIYFSAERRARVLEELISALRPGGYLFLGHAEGIHERDESLEFVCPSTYRKTKD